MQRNLGHCGRLSRQVLCQMTLDRRTIFVRLISFLVLLIRGSGQSAYFLLILYPLLQTCNADWI